MNYRGKDIECIRINSDKMAVSVAWNGVAYLTVMLHGSPMISAEIKKPKEVVNALEVLTRRGKDIRFKAEDGRFIKVYHTDGDVGIGIKKTNIPIKAIIMNSETLSAFKRELINVIGIQEEMAVKQ
ncbi:hypothetical protein COK15_28385 [Bacillus cereus]|uniref:hypothetical protein n=1 Tax=Bacillus cereus TaxID=1396 RepID=UPI000BF88921|nr:hypothetical protein [Bacillus cereus]PFQ72458.1 hypothetical protein COK15_28385 [Bacillus cereus]